MSTGLYRVKWKDGSWVVVAPDGSVHKRLGVEKEHNAQAHVLANRLNDELRRNR
jgi:hypothetical protein